MRLRNWITHMRVDMLIRQAFGGKAGGQLSPADPPPMEHPAFLEAAQKWLDVGGVCGRWKGQIAQIETFNAGTSLRSRVNLGTNAVTESANARRHLRSRHPRGERDRLTVSMRGISTVIQTLNLPGPNGPCTSVNTATQLAQPADDGHRHFRPCSHQ